MFSFLHKLLYETSNIMIIIISIFRLEDDHKRSDWYKSHSDHFAIFSQNVEFCLPFGDFPKYF